MPSARLVINNFWWGAILLMCLWGISTHVEGASTTQATQTVGAKTDQSLSAIQATGYLDLRPSWITKTGGFTTENTLEIGAKLNADTSVAYMQGFVTNLYDPVNLAENRGMKFSLDAGAVRFQIKNIWKSEGNGLALSYENRIYLPVDLGSQSKGIITSIRNYLKLSKSVSDNIKVTLSDAVIPIINSRSGNSSSAGVFTSNNIFENRVYLITDIQLTEKLSLSIPVMFHQTRAANYRSEASNNAAWSFLVWTSPELDYAVNDHLTLGLSYYNNESFFSSNLSKAQFRQAFESGEVQFVLTASL
jgi:hypothetical protein